jgi:hypothetical protein
MTYLFSPRIILEREVNIFANIFPIKGWHVGMEVCDQKGVVFTRKDASDLNANKIAVKDGQHLNIDFVICM